MGAVFFKLHFLCQEMIIQYMKNIFLVYLAQGKRTKVYQPLLGDIEEVLVGSGGSSVSLAHIHHDGIPLCVGAVPMSENGVSVVHFECPVDVIDGQSFSFRVFEDLQ